MKTKDVEIGGIYAAEVSGKMTRVRIDVKLPVYSGIRSGWSGTNLATGREVYVKSAQRLRYRIPKD